MLRISTCLLLTCGFLFGQEVRKPDFQGLEKSYPNDHSGLLAKTIAVFSLPPERTAERQEMLTRLNKEGEFPRWASMAANQLERQPGNAEVVLDFYENIALWLEQSDLLDLKDANLSWVTSGSLRFFGSMNNLPDLCKGDWRKAAAEWEEYEKGSIQLAERRFTVARRLALALFRSPTTVEEGFRLLSAAGGLDVPKAEMDSAARTALAVTSDRLLSLNSGDTCFQLHYKGGGSGGGQLGKYSSARWLAARLAVEPADKVIPLSWLAKLRETDPGRAELIAALRERCGWARLEELWPKDWESIENLGPVTAMLLSEIFANATASPGSEAFFVSKLGSFPTIRPQNSPFDNAPIMLLIRGALLAAATSNEPTTRENLCRLVGRIVYGGVVSPDASLDPDGAINYGGIFIMGTALMEWPSADRAASLRLIATLHRLRVPFGGSTYALTDMFPGKPPLTYENADRLLESGGWLTDAHNWNPPRVIMLDYRLDSMKRKRLLGREELLGRILVDHPDFDIRGYAEHLKKREKGRFGALLFASQLVPENERDALILSAFSEMEEGWAKNPNSPQPPFSLITDMLAPESAAKLPAFLRAQH